MEQIALQWDAGPRVLTVSELTVAIGDLLAREFGLLWVAGEISGCRQPSSGHYYFTLKDKDAQLSAVCYKGSARYLKFKPRDGVAVIARGRIDVWPPQGKYQFVVESLEPQGYGALQFEFEQLKKKLAMEGLFDAARKRPLPKLPMRIGLVTSPTGAVIQDILNILSRRFPGLHIRLFPAAVQGEGSVEAVCRGLTFFSVRPWADVVILARGGGSLEDLWTFNDERVARAIVASAVPVISAIGHETDFTIADFVADLRAPTPSAAAELVICTRDQLLEQIAGCRRKLEQAARYRILQSARTLHRLGAERSPGVLQRSLARRAQRLDDFDYRLREQARGVLEDRRRYLRDLDVRLLRRDIRIAAAHSRRRVLTAGHDLHERARAALHLRARKLAMLDARLRQADPKLALARKRQRLDAADRAIRASLAARQRQIQAGRHRIERARAALWQGLKDRIADARHRASLAAARLEQLSPDRTAVPEARRRLEGVRTALVQQLRHRLDAARHRLEIADARLGQLRLDSAVAQALHRLDRSQTALLQQVGHRIDAARHRLEIADARLGQLRLDSAVAAARQRLDRAQRALVQQVGHRIDAARHSLEIADARLGQLRLDSAVAEARQRLDRVQRALVQAFRQRTAGARNRVELATAKLEQLGPHKVLERGYAIVQTTGGAVVKAPADAPAGSDIRIRVAHGRLQATVTTPDDSSELPS